MRRTACTEPQCLYKGDLYLLYHKKTQRTEKTWTRSQNLSWISQILEKMSGVFCNWNPQRLCVWRTENKDTGRRSTTCVSSIKAHWSNSCSLSWARVLSASSCWLMTLPIRLTLSNAKKTLLQATILTHTGPGGSKITPWQIRLHLCKGHCYIFECLNQSFLPCLQTTQSTISEIFLVLHIRGKNVVTRNFRPFVPRENYFCLRKGYD